MRLKIALVLLALLSACQTAPSNAPQFSAAPVAPAGYGTVYLYRYHAPPYTGLIEFDVSGRRIFAAPDQAYTWLHVRAGEHTVYAQWPNQPGWKSPPVVKIEVTEGASVYVRAESAVGLVAPGWTTPGAMSLSTRLTEKPQELGPVELRACCRYMPPVTSILQ
jgi:hypothetical protein